MQISTRSLLIFFGLISLFLTLNTWPTEHKLPGVGIELTSSSYGWPLEVASRRIWADMETGMMTEVPEFTIRYNTMVLNAVLGLAISAGFVILIERILKKTLNQP